jgi:hypothetical protein
VILDPYSRIVAETWEAAEAMVVADLDATLLAEATGRLWRARPAARTLHPAHRAHWRGA